MARFDLSAKETADAARPLWPLLLATLGTVVAAPLYVMLLDVPSIRSTGWPMFLLAGVGAVAGAVYARQDDRAWVRLTGVGNLAALCMAAVWFFWLASFPVPDPKASSLTAAPDFRLSDQEGRSVSLSKSYQSGPVLLVFYRGSWCPFCVSELRGLGGIQDELREAGVRILAVSVDPPGRAQQAVDRLALKFPLLSDREKTVISDYGIVDRAGGPGGEDIALPAQFLIDREGQIVWRRVARRVHDRIDPQELLRIVGTDPFKNLSS